MEAKQTPTQSVIKNEHSRVRTRPGSRCVCGAELPAGQLAWFCSDRCREEVQRPICEQLGQLLIQRGLQRHLPHWG